MFFSQSKKLIFDWKAHIMRSENQDQAKQDVLKSLDETSTLITMDWAMKFQWQKYREKQSEWFGKRGLSWHVSSAAFKTGPKEEPTVTTYAHLFDSSNQDWFAVASILENVLQLLKKEYPSITKAYLRSDEAGCYHNNFLICSIRQISHTAAFFWLHNIKRISRFLPRDKLEMVLQAFVTSRIDYCNGFLYGLPDCEIAKLQRVQNAAARLLMPCKKYDHNTPILINLHWLPVRYRINFKIYYLLSKPSMAWYQKPIRGWNV